MTNQQKIDQTCEAQIKEVLDNIEKIKEMISTYKDDGNTWGGVGDLQYYNHQMRIILGEEG